MLLKKEALGIIDRCRKDTIERFQIDFVTYDRKRGTGGEPKRLDDCFVTGSNHNQFENGTITIQTAQVSHPITVHVNLIMKINGQWVKQ